MGANMVEEVSDFIKCVLQADGAVNVQLGDERFDPTVCHGSQAEFAK
jgi:hypothetical protein